MHFFVTGHTGFKGAWLTLLLKSRGHEVSGFSNIAKNKDLYTTANLKSLLKYDFCGDVRNEEQIKDAINVSNPDVIIHLAAQSLVLRSYKDPVETFTTNVNGTLNLLNIASNFSGIKAILIITTDKVYRNDEKKTGYLESDSLGGHDPYSASKAMADLLTQSFINLNGSIPIGIARAGNVIGGGDFGEHRIIPDIIRAINTSFPLVLRNPNSVRPWQHVLDCLTGYLSIVDLMIKTQRSGIWNIGPRLTDYKPVNEIVNYFISNWPNKLSKSLQPTKYQETNFLTLDSSKIMKESGWRNVLDFEKSLLWTSNWYNKTINLGIAPLDASMEDISLYTQLFDVDNS